MPVGHHDMLQEFLIAFALVFVIEGIFPALNPGAYRRTLKTVSAMEDKTVRLMGLASLIAGAVLVYLLT